MNILLINQNKGAGVEFEGNLFLEILKKIDGITSVETSRTQDTNYLKKNLDFSKYDLILLNDISNIEDRYVDLLPDDKPIININFGGGDAHGKYPVDLVLDINHPYTMYRSVEVRNVFPLSFISGNIWKNIKPWNERSDDLLYVSRLAKTKIEKVFLELLRKNKKTVDFYGPIMDNDYYEEYKDVINYKGFIDHKELLNVYNSYKKIYLFSTTECLSMTLREAILCGTVPIILDINGYSKVVSDYVIKFRINDENIFDVDNDINKKKQRIKNDIIYLNNLFSFDKLILDFITALRSLLLKDFRFNKNANVVCRVINDLDDQKITGHLHKSDTIEWDKVNL